MGRDGHGRAGTGLALLLTLWGSSTPGEGPQEPSASEREPFKSFALYALSRGKGVPAPASAALRRVRDLAEADREGGVAVTIHTERIGLEGERRLCVEYQDEEKARRLFGRAKALVKGVDLVRVVVETCVEPEEGGEKKKGAKL